MRISACLAASEAMSAASPSPARAATIGKSPDIPAAHSSSFAGGSSEIAHGKLSRPASAGMASRYSGASPYTAPSAEARSASCAAPACSVRCAEAKASSSPAAKASARRTLAVAPPFSSSGTLAVT